MRASTTERARPIALPRPLRIHYHRPPDRVQVFEQTLIREGSAGSDGALISYMPEAGVPRPVMVRGRTVLEAASPAVWFTFPGARHDVGRFHTPAGELTGFYANILTPVEILPTAADGAAEWRTTDLFLDVFLGPDGRVELLDEDELREAVARSWLTPETAAAAEREAHRLVGLAGNGSWPPLIVHEWPLERARAAAEGGA